MNDSTLDGIKVNAYELGWRFTGDNLRTQVAAYYSLSDKTITINKSDMTINWRTTNVVSMGLKAGGLFLHRQRLEHRGEL